MDLPLDSHRHLLLFAHRNEAVAFLENIQDLKSIDQNVYENEKIRIVITGEGFEKSLFATAFHLSDFKPDQVINFGICGALTKNLEFKKIYPIRTVYRANKRETEFKSFSSNGHSTIDCLTSSERIYDEELTALYSNFAHLVDRELWGIGFACQESKTPFFAYKLVSDFAGDDAACELVKQKAREYSHDLFLFYKNQNFEKKIANTSKDLDLYLTESMSRTFESLKQALENKFKQPLHDISELQTFIADFPKDIRPKTKALKVIDKMKRMLSPVHFEYVDKISEALKSYESDERTITFDQSLEDTTLRSNIRYKNKGELLEHLKKLQEIPFEKLDKLFNGVD